MERETKIVSEKPRSTPSKPLDLECRYLRRGQEAKGLRPKKLTMALNRLPPLQRKAIESRQEDEQWPRPRKNRRESNGHAESAVREARGARGPELEARREEEMVRYQSSLTAMEPGDRVIAQNRSLKRWNAQLRAPDTVESGPTKPTTTRRYPKRVSDHRKVQVDLRVADTDQRLRFVRLPSSNLGGMM